MIDWTYQRQSRNETDLEHNHNAGKNKSTALHITSELDKVNTYEDTRHDRSAEHVLQAVTNSNEEESSNDIEEAEEHSERSILGVAAEILAHAVFIVGLWSEMESTYHTW